MTDDAKRTSLSDRLNQTLEVAEQQKKQEIISEFIADKDTQDDFEYSRKVIKDMIDKGKEAVDELGEVAKESDQARHYEVLSNLIKTTSDNAQALMDIRKKKRDLDRNLAPTPDVPQIPGTPGQTNVFIGTTADVLQMIKDNTAPKTVDVTPKKDD